MKPSVRRSSVARVKPGRASCQLARAKRISFDGQAGSSPHDHDPANGKLAACPTSPTPLFRCPAPMAGSRGSTVFDPEAQTRRELAEVRTQDRRMSSGGFRPPSPLVTPSSLCPHASPLALLLLSTFSFRLSAKPGQFDCREVSLRVEIIFSRFIDDAKLLALRGVRIRKHSINLAAFERDFVALVSNANRKFFSSRPHRI